MFKWKPTWKQYRAMCFISVAILAVWQPPFSRIVVALIILVLVLDWTLRYLKQRLGRLKKRLGL